MPAQVGKLYPVDEATRDPEFFAFRGRAAVELADGGAGFVASIYVRSRVGYRAGFTKRDGRWVLEFLVAGD